MKSIEDNFPDAQVLPKSYKLSAPTNPFPTNLDRVRKLLVPAGGRMNKQVGTTRLTALALFPRTKAEEEEEANDTK